MRDMNRREKERKKRRKRKRKNWNSQVDCSNWKRQTDSVAAVTPFSLFPLHFTTFVLLSPVVTHHHLNYSLWPSQTARWAQWPAKQSWSSFWQYLYIFFNSPLGRQAPLSTQPLSKHTDNSLQQKQLSAAWQSNTEWNIITISTIRFTN